MTLRILMPVVIAGMLFSGCEKDKKRITAEPVQHTDQRRTVPSTSASPERTTAPERRDQKEAAQERQLKRDSRTGKPLAEQKHEEHMAAVPSSKREGDAKQAESVTPRDQSESEADIAVTQRIRQALLREDLSFTAKNIFIITEADHVVLKGQVRSQSEAERIKGIAETLTSRRVEDVLEVTP